MPIPRNWLIGGLLVGCVGMAGIAVLVVSLVFFFLMGSGPARGVAGKLVFRDWYRTKMIMRVDLASGKEVAIADGTDPTALGDRLLGYGDSTSAYVVRDSAGKILHTARFNEELHGPILSPDGTRLLATVFRAGPPHKIGDMTFPGPKVFSTAIFDLSGREISTIVGYDDAAWTPDGKIIATGSLHDPGLFEIDPATKAISSIDATVTDPSSPCVSPNGKTIAFVTGQKVWLIDRNGKNLRQLFPHGRDQLRPAFSPDGTKVAIVVCNLLAVTYTGEVFVIDVKSQQVTAVRVSTGEALVPDATSRLNWIP